MAVGAASVPLAFVAQGDNAHAPDALGWTLFGLSALTLAWRRHYPMGVLLALVVVEGVYHSLDNAHSALIAVTMIAIYSLAVAGPRRRTLAVVPALLGISVCMISLINPNQAMELARISGWILACAITGEAVRVHRNYLGAIVERAERAERTREETAARRVAEERLRIARDLHDLLAHSITLIGVQAGAAAHVLNAAPERLDRKALADSLDRIAGTCRDARSDLKRTLQVLRADENSGPPPGLTGLADLVKAAQSTGACVVMSVAGVESAVPPAVGAAAYRIVQQALTNAVQHAGPAVGIRVALHHTPDALRVTVSDDGGRPRPAPDGDARPLPGFGIVGMRERARSVGGTVEAADRSDGPGFTVQALLPCAVPNGAS